LFVLVIHTVEFIFGLMVEIASLALLASKIGVAYPILFVIGGPVPGTVFCFFFLRCFTRPRCSHRGGISARTCVQSPCWPFAW